jgi:hypothetical protein
MISIDRDGVVKGGDEADRLALSNCAGNWNVGAAAPGVVILIRADGKAIPLMGGVLTRTGWIVDVVAQVSTSRLSGVLTAESGAVRRELYFEHGALRMAASTAQSDLLGEFLVTEGAITREQLEAALRKAGGGQKLGEILSAMGVLTGAEVYWLLLRKIEKVFRDVIALRSGTYSFQTGIDLTRLPASLFLDTQALLLEGVRVIDELEYCRHTIPALSAVARQNPAILRTCTDLERRFVECVNSTSTVADIEQQLQLGLHEAATALNGLVAKGIVETIQTEDMEDRAVHAISEGFNNALTCVYSAASQAGFVEELIRSARDFPRHGKHGNRTMAHVMLRQDGLLDEQNVRELIEGSNERDRIKCAIVVLTQYISYVLFTANARLSAEQQQRLTGEANAALAGVIVTYM